MNLRKFIPSPLLAIYHYALSILGAIIFGFPSKNIFVLGITGTKGKTTTVELVNAILEAADKKTSIASTLRFKIGDKSERNLLKMTMPGRFFLQKFLSDSVKAKCDYVIMEMTSEGAKQFRHKFIALDALIVTNITPEHIESHGSYEKYVKAKVSIAEALASSSKPNRTIFVNEDAKENEQFLILDIPNKVTYKANDASLFTTKLSEPFNQANIAAAVAFTKSQNISEDTINGSIESFKGVPGRMEYINVGQRFDVIVDYAHTPESLEAVYQSQSTKRLICVLGGTGGGRDKWKRPKMGAIADTYCNKIFLTNEDPYDEDPNTIIDNIASGVTKASYTKIIDRREAIARAVASAGSGDVIIITGKGTDPFIMGPRGSKEPWDDAKVATEELNKL